MKRALALVLIVLASAAGAATLSKVAIEGDPAPDPGFFYHHRFYNPSVGDGATGRVAAIVRLIPAVGRYCAVKFDPGPGPDTLLACPKAPSPDGGHYGKLFDPTIAAAGTAAWASRLTFNRTGISRGDPASLVDLTGDPRPGGPGLIENYRTAVIDDAGDVVFAADVSGGPIVLGVEVDRGLFRCTGGDGNCHNGTGTLEELALVDDLVPDRPGRHLCTIDAFGASTYGVAFRAGTKLDCANNSEAPFDGVFLLPFGGAVSTLALETEACQPFPAPGGTVYGAISKAPAIADTGVVSFLSRTTGLVVNDVLYRCTPGVCPATFAEVAVKAGDLDDAGNALRLFNQPGVSDAGDVAFMARAGEQRRVSGEYLAHPGGDIETIALVNDTAPGVSPLATFNAFGPPGMSPGGKVAFWAKVQFAAPPRKKLEGLFLRE